MNSLGKRVHESEVSRVVGQVKSARLSDDNLSATAPPQLHHHGYATHSYLTAPDPSQYFPQQQYVVTAGEDAFPMHAPHHFLQHPYSQPQLQPSLVASMQHAMPPNVHLLEELAGGHFAMEQEQQMTPGQDTFPHGRSIPVHPQPDGFPSLDMFERVMNDYILSLSPKKRDKALIPKKRCDNIEAVLSDPKCTTIESAQFRFWAKKMFTLENVGYNNPQTVLVCHEGKPVAVRERLFQVLTKAHLDCQHGGRDKTSAQVRKSYSWVPKELIARFVRNCPTCSMRRNPVGYDPVPQSTPKAMPTGAQATPPGSATTSPVAFQSAQPTPGPMMHSPPASRRTSVVATASGQPLNAMSAHLPGSGSMVPVSIPSTPASMTPSSAMSHSPFEGPTRANLAFQNVIGMQGPMGGLNTMGGINNFQGDSFSYEPQIYSSGTGQ